MAGGNNPEMTERNDEFSLSEPETWLKEVSVGNGQTVNVPVMLLIAKEQKEQNA